MLIETKTIKARKQIAEAIIKSGHTFTMNYGGKYAVKGIVTMKSDVPRSVIDAVNFNPRAVTIRD